MSALALMDRFYVSGGTMPEDAASYVERAADRHLLNSLQEGKFCYVLNSRQMGKSSMCVRTKMQLEQDGVRTAFVDLTKIGGRNVTAEQWYAGLIVEVGRALGLRVELLEYWKDNSHLSPMQRFFGGIREVVLEKIRAKVVIFVDEIDSTRSLPFDTDEFFAGIRECFNHRVQDPEYNRLTFCLLGVAVPSDLIRNAQTTPFNIGERVYLKDFTLEEASALAKGLPGRESLVNRIHYWTHGHPFLTQSVCTAIKNDPSITTDEGVDRMVSRDLFEPKARETNINLADVGNRVLNGYAEGDDINKFRADILSAYDKAIRGKSELQDDESNRVTAVLKLSGLMRSEGKSLKVRNPIYEHVFGKEWVKENMPGQELRRQRRAFFLGVARTAFVSVVVIAIIAYLALANHRLALTAEAQAREGRYQAYVASMDLMPVLYDQRNLTKIRKVLDAHKEDPWRGPEWSYWGRISHEAVAEGEVSGIGAFVMSLSSDQKFLVQANGSEIKIYDAHDVSLVRKFDVPYKNVLTATYVPGTAHILILSRGGGGGIIDSQNGKELVALPADFGANPIAPDFYSKGKLLFGGTATTQGYLDLQTGTYHKVDNPFPKSATFNIGENFVVGVAADKPSLIRTYAMDFKTVIREYPITFQPAFVQTFHDGKHAIIAGLDGEIAVLDLQSGKVVSQIKTPEPVLGFSISQDDSLVGINVRRRASGLVDCKNYTLQFRRWYPEANLAIVYPDKSRYATMYTNIKLYDPTLPPVVRTYQLGTGPWAASLRNVNGKQFLNAVRQGTGDVKTDEIGDGVLIPRTDLGPGKLVKNAFTIDPNFFELLVQHDKDFAVEDLFGHRMMPVSIKGTPIVPRISSNGEVEAVTLDGFNIDIYDRKTGAKKTTIKLTTRLSGMQFDLQGKRLAISQIDQGVTVVDVDGWKVLWSHNMHAQGIRSLRFSKDGKLLLTCGDDDTARLWDAVTGAKLLELTGCAQSVVDGDITPDGSRIITVSDDQTVRVWDAKTGLETTTLGSTGAGPLFCRLTLDSKYIVTTDTQGEVKFWPVSAK